MIDLQYKIFLVIFEKTQLKLQEQRLKLYLTKTELTQDLKTKLIENVSSYSHVMLESICLKVGHLFAEQQMVVVRSFGSFVLKYLNLPQVSIAPILVILHKINIKYFFILLIFLNLKKTIQMLCSYTVGWLTFLALNSANHLKQKFKIVISN